MAKFEISCRLDDRPLTALTLITDPDPPNEMKYFAGRVDPDRLDGAFYTQASDESERDWTLAVLAKLGATRITVKSLLQ